MIKVGLEALVPMQLILGVFAGTMWIKLICSCCSHHSSDTDKKKGISKV